MKAIFKPEDANKLIVRDADINEASLIINFLDKIKNGATLAAQATFNGNYETNGILFTIEDAPVVPDVPSYIGTSVDVVNDPLDLPVFKITVNPASPNYVSFKVDINAWETLKTTLEGLGLESPSIKVDGTITAANNSGEIITATIVIPKGLFQFVSEVDSTVNNFNDNIVLTLGE